MKRYRIISFILIVFASLFLMFKINNVDANTTLSENAEVMVDCEMNSKKTVIRFIVTSKGVSLNDIDSIELVLKKNDQPTKKQLFINKVYTSISNASKEYNKEDNTYYGILILTDAKELSNAKISCNTIITYSDNSYKTLDSDKIINIPNIPLYEYVDGSLYFGSYPQSKLSDTSIIGSLNELVGTPTNPKNGYEWVDYNYYNKNQVESYMYYVDVDFDNDDVYDYRGVYFTKYRPYAIDIEANSANSNQDGNGYYTKTIYWFKYEPIAWDIVSVDNGKAILSAKKSIDTYHYVCAKGLSTTEPNTINGIDNRYLVAYDSSDLRIWLNDNFYNTAFDDMDKSIIRNEEISNSIDTFGGTQSKNNIINDSSIIQEALFGENTSDKVFTLSFKEVEDYYPRNSLRIFSSTDYTVCQGFDLYSNYNSGDTWTRSPSEIKTQPSYVTRSGNLYQSGNVNYSAPVTFIKGIRPAIVVDLETFNLNLSVNNSEYGSININGDSNRAHGEKVNLLATENEGYSFDGWYNGFELVSSDKEYTFIMPNGDCSLEARFTYYTVSTFIDDQDAGEITSFDNERISSGSEVELSINLNDGYSLDGWYIGENLISEDEEFTYTMTKENVIIVAKTSKYHLTTNYYLANNFEGSYKVSFVTNNDENINYQYTNNLIVPILTKDGYQFAGWYDNPSFEGDAVDFTTINKDITVYAKWLLKDSNYIYISGNQADVKAGDEIRTTIESHGTEYSDYAAIVAFKTGNINIYNYYHYIDNDGHGVYEISNSNKEVIEEFNISGYDDGWTCKTYQVKAGDILYIRFRPTRLWYGYTNFNTHVYFTQDYQNNGYDYGISTIYDNECVKAGTRVSLTAYTRNNTTFIGWYNGDTLLSESNTYSFRMPKENLSIYAKYEYFTVTTTTNIDGAGTYSKFTNYIYTRGYTLTLNATVNDGYAFLGWYNGDTLLSDDLRYPFVMDDTIVIEARYQELNITLNKTIDEAGLVSYSANPIIGNDVTITATVNDGYIFTGWYKDGLLVSEDVTLTYTFILQESVTFEARYIINNISVSISLDEAGTIKGFNRGFVLGEEALVSVDAIDGYSWYGWFLISDDNEEKVSDEYNINILISSDTKNYVARFEKYVLTIETNYEKAYRGYALITFDTQGGNEIAPIKSNELTYIVPKRSGYLFAGWYDDLEYNVIHDFNSIIEEDIILYAKWISEELDAMPFNETFDTTLPIIPLSGDGGPKWYSIYALKDSACKLTMTYSGYNGSYGHRITVYEADKTTEIAYSESTRNLDLVLITFNIEEGKTYYIKTQRYYSNSSASVKFTLNVDLPTISCKTSNNNDIVKAGEIVKLFAGENEGYSFIGWYNSNNELVSENKYYSFVMPEASILYTAKYKVSEVTYTVNHYLENIDDDEYTLVLDDVVIKTGNTEDLTLAVVNSYVGFVALDFEQEVIKGDGTTVINIYYDRLEYNLDLSLVNIINDSIPGNINLESDTYKYGKSISLVATLNEGYSFIGWFNGDTLLLDELEYTFEMPNNDYNIVAKFESLIVEYKITYSKENLDDGYTDEVITKTGYSGSICEVEVDDYEYFVTPSIDEYIINGDGSTNVIVKYDRQRVNVMVAINYYDYNKKYGTVDNLDGFTDERSYFVGTDNNFDFYYKYKASAKCGTVIYPTLNFNNGYQFEGWYINDTKLQVDDLDSFSYTISYNDINSYDTVCLIARVNIKYYVHYYYQDNINDYLDGYSRYRTYTLDETIAEEKWIKQGEMTNVVAEDLNYIKQGYEFLESVNDSFREYSTNNIVKVRLVPKKYTLTIERTFGGAHVYYDDDYSNGSYELYYGQNSLKITADTSETYGTFAGWYIYNSSVVSELDDNLISLDSEIIFTMVNHDITITPVYEMEYTLRIVKYTYPTGQETDEVIDLREVGYVGFNIDEEKILTKYASMLEGYEFKQLLIYDSEQSSVPRGTLSDNSSAIVVFEVNRIYD